MPWFRLEAWTAMVAFGLLTTVGLITLVSGEVADSTWIRVVEAPPGMEAGRSTGHVEQGALAMIFDPLTRVGMQKVPPKKEGGQVEVGGGGGAEDGAEVWEGHPQVVRRHDATYFEGVLGRRDIQSILDSCVAVNGTGKEPMYNAAGSKGKDFRLVRRTRGQDGEWWSGGVPGDALNSSMIRYYVQKQGFTLVLNHMDFRVDGVARLARSLENQMGVAVQANLYLTPPGSQGFEVHWDPMETIVLQVSGSKLWHIYDPLVTLPRPEQRFKPKAAQIDESSKRSVMLEAGDTLYIPRGWMHEATTEHSEGRDREHSIHITVGVDAQALTIETLAHVAVRQISRASGVGDEMHWCIRGEAEKDERLRRGLWGRKETPIEMCDVARAVLEGCEEETGRRLMKAAAGEFGDMQMWISHGRGTKREPSLPQHDAFSHLKKQASVSLEGQPCLQTLEQTRQFGKQAQLKREHQRAQVLARHHAKPTPKPPSKQKVEM